MNAKAILDGKEVDSTDIDSSRHRFVGTFRYPTVQQHVQAREEYCPICRRALRTSMIELTSEHWLAGHFDLMQYVSIESR